MRKLGALLTQELLTELQTQARASIAPLLPGSPALSSYVSGARTQAGRDLPPYYVVYFLLVGLLKFPNLGREEKVDWSVPVELDGQTFFVEHRKFGLGVFPLSKRNKSNESSDIESNAEVIVNIIKKTAKVAEPFFAHLAAKAVESSQLNVKNNSRWLFERYTFARDQFKKKLREAEANKGKRVTKQNKNDKGEITSWITSFPEHKLRQQVEWLGLSAIEAFFGWTEHVFIHIAILEQKIKTGEQFEDVAFADWQKKAKNALDISTNPLKAQYDDLLTIRTQIRNYIAHGAFGKSGEAFDFHSSAGAVPVSLTGAKGHYAMTSGKQFDAEDALEIIEAFIKNLWSGHLKAAELYIQDAQLPLVLTYASDGTYKEAMQSMSSMEDLVSHMTRMIDDSANMDW